MELIFGKKEDPVTAQFFAVQEPTSFLDELAELKNRNKLFLPALERVLAECDFEVHNKRSGTWTIHVNIGLPPADGRSYHWNGWNLRLSKESDKFQYGSYERTYDEVRCIHMFNNATLHVAKGFYAGIEMKLCISAQYGIILEFAFEDYMSRFPLEVVPDWIVLAGKTVQHVLVKHIPVNKLSHTQEAPESSDVPAAVQ